MEDRIKYLPKGFSTCCAITTNLITSLLSNGNNVSTLLNPNNVNIHMIINKFLQHKLMNIDFDTHILSVVQHEDKIYGIQSFFDR